MKLSSLFMGKLENQTSSAENEHKPKNSASGFDGFSNFLERVEQSSKEKTPEQNNPVNKRDDNKTNYQKSKKDVNNSKERPNVSMEKSKEQPEKTNKTESQKSEDVKADEQKPKETEDLDSVEEIDEKAVAVTETVDAPKIDEASEKAIEKAIQNLADILDVSTEQIKQTLVDLNMTVSDLSKNENMSSFMQAIYGVGSPVELLNVPNINQVHSEVVKVIKEFQQELKNPTALTSNVGVLDKNLQENLKQLQQQSSTEDTQSNAQETKAVTNQAQNLVVSTVKGGMSSNNNDLLNSSKQGNNMESNTDLVGHNTTPTTNTTNFTDALSKTKSTSTVNTREVIDQIVEKMKVDVRGNLTEVKITLRPEHLGDVTMKIATENGRIIAHFVAENQRVKEVIESNFNQLKDSLQQQGIEISELQVSVGQDENQQMQQFMHNQNQNKSSQRIQQIINNISEEELNAEAEQALTNLEVDFSSSVDYSA